MKALKLRYWIPAVVFALLFSPISAWAQSGGLAAFTSTPGPGGSQTYTLPIQTLITLTALTFIPAALLMMTSFTRIIIVLGLLRHALGTQSSPPTQILVGLALFLTFFHHVPGFGKGLHRRLSATFRKPDHFQSGRRTWRRSPTQLHAQTNARDRYWFICSPCQRP